MSDEDLKVPDELFKDVKFYVVGDIDQKVVQLLKDGKAKEVSYNALATHIIAEDADNPEVGESREVFDLPVVKPSWVILSVRCGDLLPVTGFSPESGQLFFGVTACLSKLPEDLNALWALITFYGGDCQLNLNKKCTHLIAPEPKGAKYMCALNHSSIKIVTPEWILESVASKSRKDEVAYHPRLTYLEEDEEESADEYDQGSQSDGSYTDRRSRGSSPGSFQDGSPMSTPGRSPKNRREGEIMFDDSSDSSPEKEDRNLNWTPAEMSHPTAAKRRLPQGKESGLINLCASVPPVPPVPGSLVPPQACSNLCTNVPPNPEVRSNVVASGPSTPGVEKQEAMASWNPAVRTLRNITNNADIQQVTRPSNVAHILQTLSAPTKSLEQQGHPSQPAVSTNALLFGQVKPQGQQLPGEAQQSHPQQHLLHLQPQQLMIPQPNFPQTAAPQHHFLQQSHPQQIHQQIFSQQQQQQQQQPQQPPQQPQMQGFTQQQMRPQQLLRPPLQQLQQQQQQQQQQQHALQLHRLQLHQQHMQQQQQQLLQQHMQQQQMQQLQQLQNQNAQQPLQNQMQQTQLQPPQQQQLFGHEPGLDIPDDSFLVGCVFAIADYPEQMSDKQLLATWKRIIQAYGGTVDSSLNSRCTHLLCESQVSSMYVQALREGKRCVTAHWLNTILRKKKMSPPDRTLHFPFAFPPGAKPCSQHIISVTGFVDTDRDDLKLMAYLTGARYTGYLCRSNTALICKEPVGLKYEKAKEWRIPCVNAQWLCDILLGNFEALRQIQHSRYSTFNLPDPLAPNQHLVHNLLAAWRNPLKISPEAQMSIRVQQKQKQNTPSPQPPAKKLRIEDLPTPTKKLPPESTPFVFFTGFEPGQVQQYIKKLYDLGGEVAENAQKCTHLVANKVTRTVKFLTAMSVVKHIVTPDWLEESWKSQKFVDEQSFMLRDAEAEVLFCFSLEESLRRAHTAPSSRENIST
ncbi:hypothetical protein AGOR_G00040390 [Albula goreensis]|uniref:PAX-interacting protein 1 n=1 Tax=Albula goreensis TaxID=1534307 RepID=A0A8T3E564_9TELE|nr:hypothetical protein AGOR_G00040390 [Albula goreensis]